MKRYGSSLRKRLPSSAAKRSRTSGPLQSTGFMIGSPVLSGIVVTPQTALQFSSVFSAVNVIATDTACLPFGTWRETGPNSRLPAPDAQSSPLMSQRPNKENTPFRFRQALMGHVLLWGNGYAEIVRDDWDGVPRSLHLLHPGTTQPKRDKHDNLIYVLTDTGKRLAPENVLHVAGLGFDGIVGYSAIHQCRQGVGLGIAAEEFGAAFFGNGATPGGVMTVPRKLSPMSRQNLRESIYGTHQTSKNAHNLMILEEGADWKPTTMPLDDAQFLATRQFQNLEIARLYRIPPHKLGDYSQSHLANIEESNINYIETTLYGWARAIESEFDSKLLFQSELEEQIFWYHNFSVLKRGNTAARTTYYQGMRNMGAMSANDIRAQEGMNPLPPGKGGDTYVIQGQYVPLEKAGEIVTKPPPKDDDDKPAEDDKSKSNGRHLPIPSHF